MRKIYFAIVFVFMHLPGRTQTSVHDGEIMLIRGKWTKEETVNGHNDPALFSSQFPALLKRTDTLAALLKTCYPEPTGIEAIYYSTINHSPLFNGAPASYGLNSLYKSYYFNTNLKKIMLGGETETWIDININNFGNLLHEDGIWIIDGKPTTAYTTWPKDGEWKGFPLYKNEDRIRGDDKAILITRNGRLPFIPLTQKQYLLALKNRRNTERANIYTPDKAEKDFQLTIAAIRNNKALSVETKEKMITDMQQIHAGQMANSSESMNKMNSAFDQKILTIDNYLSSHSDLELQQPVVTSRLWDFPGYFGAEKNQRAYTPVRIDPSYFDSTLPHNTPQFIVMQWTIGKDAPKTAFGKILEADFPVSKLAVMVNSSGKDKDLSNEPLVKGPDMEAIRKKAELYADSVLKKKPVMFTAPFAIAKPIDTGTSFKIPPRNEGMLGAIPSKKMTSVELQGYLENIEKKYTSLLISEGRKLPEVTTLSAADISDAATLYLLSGANDQAAWCAFKSVEKDPDDVVLLNNAGAVLNACGFQPVAIPILQNALDKLPNNSTLENNIGQSYIMLGDVTKAKTYLQNVLTSSPYHPHANFSLACIEYAKGNNSGALNYVQKSLRGSYTDGAMHLLYKLNPDARLWNILKGHYKATDYFNEDKYHLPKQCENISEVTVLRAEYKGYREMVERVKKQFDDIRKSENEAGVKAMMESTHNYQNSSLRTSPFTELGAMMVKEIILRLGDEQDRLSRAQIIYKKEIQDLYDAYNYAYSHAASCAEQLALGNTYMEKMAAVTTEYQKIWLPVYREFFDDYAYWGRIQFSDKHLQRAAYAAAASGYLGELLRLAETHFLNLCDPETDIKKNEDDYKIPEPDCGLDIGFKFGVGSVRIDCEKMEFHFGEFIIADVVHTYKTHSTTIAIGAGLQAEFGGEKLKAGPIQGGFTARGSMQYFVTLDNEHASDQGFIWDGAIQYEQKFNTELKSGIKKIDEVKTNSVDISARTVLSLHNGFTSSGSVYEQLDKILEVKPEKQENKNVKIFKQ